VSAVANTRALRVVIIDDTPDLRELLRIALTRGGFDVVGEAGDGSKGIDVVRSHRPDVVLLDLAMPVMDGIEALPSIRRLCPDAKIIVLSGFGAQQMSARAVAAGADGYVQKGAPLNTILDYVRTLAGGLKRPARGLSVVPSGPSRPTPDRTAPDRPTAPRPPEPASRRSAEAAPPPVAAPVPAAVVTTPAAATAAHPSAWEALKLAPYGVLEVADEPSLRVVHVNPVAARLLGTDKAGTPLATVAPDLAALVAYHRLEDEPSFETDVPEGRVRASLRRTGWSMLVFLDSAAEEAGLLRRAIATTAHEVRGPVAVLCGIAETLSWEGDLVGPEQTKRLMDSVARQARILDRITADLLTAAQVQRGTLRIDHQVVDPHALVVGAIEDRWDVDVVVDDERPVRADPLRLEQMMTNLLSNAHKYGAAPYQVRIRPAGPEEPDRVAIDVVDHGEGVPPEFASHLFSEYARADASVATGNGLGLYVVRTLAQAQNGSVSYAPLPGGGSVFTITLLAA
jgi:signal transduction histidine kinase/DNA-binding NarL/FixJ family response regulator